MSSHDVRDPRRQELSDGLEGVRADIAEAARAAGRTADDVTLIAITKTWPASDVELLADLGVADVGENKHQEAAAKHDEVADAASSLRWHFVGQIQSNKATHIAAYADVVHSVASAKVARRLDKGAAEAGRQVACFVQVNLDPAEASAGRGGVPASGVEEVADAIATADHLTLAGVMGVAPLGHDAAQAYARLAGVRRDLMARHPEASSMSAGMSGDFTEAIAAGATHVRVGSAILGRRPPVG